MIKIGRNCSNILAGVLLTMLLAACGAKKADTTTATSSPDPQVFYSHSVAMSSSSIYSWGLNSYGQLGTGNIVAKTTPVAVLAGAAGTDDLTGMTGVSAGGTHTLAFVNLGSVYAWGNNSGGELGDNSSIARAIPVKVRKDGNAPPAFLDLITAVAAGGTQFSLALDSSHAVWAWGNNSLGQLGLGNSSLTPGKFAVQVVDLTANITMIAAGGSHGLALDSANNVWSWGYNFDGQLGQGLPYTNIPIPGRVVNAADATKKLTGVTYIAAGGGHSLFVDSNGKVWACGLNFFGQLGDGSTSDSKNGVVQVTGLPAFAADHTTPITPIAVAAGLDHSLALMSDNTVWAWGHNRNGQLGVTTHFNTDTAVTSPVQVLMGPSPGTTLPDIVKIVAIGNHSLARDSSGKLWAWGDNTYGQLGNGKTTDSAYAIEVKGIPNPDLYMPVPIP